MLESSHYRHQFCMHCSGGNKRCCWMLNNGWFTQYSNKWECCFAFSQQHDNNTKHFMHTHIATTISKLILNLYIEKLTHQSWSFKYSSFKIYTHTYRQLCSIDIWLWQHQLINEFLIMKLKESQMYASYKAGFEQGENALFWTDVISIASGFPTISYFHIIGSFSLWSQGQHCLLQHS